MPGTPLARLRLLGLLEGVSFLLLLGVAMPLKYLAGQPQMVRIVGAAHGLLFLLFVAAVVEVSLKLRWPLPRVLAALAASVLPFGPFVFDAHLRRTSAMPRQAAAPRTRPSRGSGARAGARSHGA